ncbi:MAG: hypothetical protein JJU11_10255 [Candidatus Sumerlaeia bacterium]|nr:hypothetical protein [Candidatus Sumerlaeia bacterium]
MKNFRFISPLLSVFILVLLISCGRREESGDVLLFAPSDDFRRVLTTSMLDKSMEDMKGVHKRMEELVGEQLGEVQLANIRFQIAATWLDEQVEEFLMQSSEGAIDEEKVSRAVQLLDGVALTNLEAYKEEAIDLFYSALDEALGEETLEEAIATFTSQVGHHLDELPSYLGDDPHNIISGFWEIREYIMGRERQSVAEMKEANRRIAQSMLSELRLAAESLRDQGRWDRDLLLEEAREFLNWEDLHGEYGSRPEFPDLIAAAFIERELEHLRARLILDHASGQNRAGRENMKEIRDIYEWVLGNRQLPGIAWNEERETFILPRFYPLLELID